MKHTQKNKLVVSFAIGFCLILFFNIGFAADSGGIQHNENSSLESPEKASKQKYTYRYYPSCSVYYDIHSKLYYYREDDSWKIFALLPSNLEGKLGDYVKIETDNDKPYLENDKHVKEFPPVESRKKKKNVWAKLIFFLFYEHASK